MSDVADMFPPGTFREEDPPDEEETPTAEAVDDEESGADEPAEETEAPSEAPLLLGKFKDADALAEAYKSLEQQFHASRQPQPEPEEEADNDPFGLWNPQLGNDDANQLAQLMMDEPQRAQEVVEWVTANPDQFGLHGVTIANQLYGIWQAQAPLDAQQWSLERLYARQQQEAEARYMERVQPLEHSHMNQMAALAVHRATTGPDALPRFSELQQNVMEQISTPAMSQFFVDHPEYRADPDKMFEVLTAAWEKVVADEYRSNARKAAVDSGQEPATPAKKPRTQARSTAAAPSSDDTVVRDLFPPGTFKEG